MAYIGLPAQIGNFVKVDNLTPSFNGSDDTFNITVSGVAYTPSNPYACLVVLGGVPLQPDVDFGVANATIVFASPPAGSTTFWMIVYGDVLDTGTVSDGTITNQKIAVGTLEYERFSATLKARLIANSIVFGA